MGKVAGALGGGKGGGSKSGGGDAGQQGVVANEHNPYVEMAVAQQAQNAQAALQNQAQNAQLMQPIMMGGQQQQPGMHPAQQQEEEQQPGQPLSDVWATIDALRGA